MSYEEAAETLRRRVDEISAAIHASALKRMALASASRPLRCSPHAGGDTQGPRRPRAAAGGPEAGAREDHREEAAHTCQDGAQRIEEGSVDSEVVKILDMPSEIGKACPEADEACSQERLPTLTPEACDAGSRVQAHEAGSLERLPALTPEAGVVAASPDPADRVADAGACAKRANR